jgi:glycosyltransferase involved in cell wall biosynthesis
VLTCRNSEDTISHALGSIMEQTITPEYIIVIDDGSTDKTRDILDGMRKGRETLYIITKPDLGYDISRVVKNWNSAIQLTRERSLPKTDYHMIATDDTIYPRHYAEEIISHLDSHPSVAIASGNYAKYYSVMPHGAGRFIRNSFFETTSWHGYYPEQMGYESAILYEANYCGFTHTVLDSVKFEHINPLGHVHKFREFGASMRTLGYHPLFVLARFAKYLITGQVTGRMGSIYMIYYYLSYNPKPEGYDRLYDSTLRQYIRSNQIKRMKGVILNLNTRFPYARC